MFSGGILRARELYSCCPPASFRMRHSWRPCESVYRAVKVAMFSHEGERREKVAVISLLSSPNQTLAVPIFSSKYLLDNLRMIRKVVSGVIWLCVCVRASAQILNRRRARNKLTKALALSTRKHLYLDSQRRITISTCA